MLGKIGSIAIRVVQLIFAAFALGFSVTAIHWQVVNSVPATTGFAAFAGGFGFVAAVIGIAAIWVSAIAGLAMSVIDTFATLFYLAGGIAFAVGLKGVNCDHGNDPYTWTNKLISGGCLTVNGLLTCDDENLSVSGIENRCRMAEADAAFLFLGFIASMIAAGFSLYFAREKKRGHSVV